jgi:hypothetical protein
VQHISFSCVRFYHSNESHVDYNSNLNSAIHLPLDPAPVRAARSPLLSTNPQASQTKGRVNSNVIMPPSISGQTLLVRIPPPQRHQIPIHQPRTLRCPNTRLRKGERDKTEIIPSLRWPCWSHPMHLKSRSRVSSQQFRRLDKGCIHLLYWKGDIIFFFVELCNLYSVRWFMFVFLGRWRVNRFVRNRVDLKNRLWTFLH